MDSEIPSKKHVSVQQMLALIDFLKEHQELASGLTRGRRGKLHTIKLWNLCAKKLNTHDDGTSKDGKGWSKYWCDWKYRVRRRALQIKASKENNKQGSPVLPLSEMEEKLMSVIGEDAIEGVVIKSDPLAERDSEEEEYGDDNVEEGPSNEQYCESTRTKSNRAKKRRHSVEMSNGDNEAGPSSPPERKPRLNGMSNEHMDEEVAQFLRLEREHLENSRRIEDSINTMATEITRLTDVLSHIRDILINNGVHIS